MQLLYILFLVLFSFVGLCIGSILVINPRLAIEIQRRFYCLINWNIEPISMAKEIRNSRIMGGFLVVISLLTIVYIIIKRV